VGTILKEECSCNKCNYIENKETVRNNSNFVYNSLQNTICVPLSILNRLSPRDMLDIYLGYADSIRHYPDNDSGLRQCDGHLMYNSTMIEGNDFVTCLSCTRCSLQALIPLEDGLRT
tara:strand:- start:460 stop:810 length:351 start_codon:yes stop_codon:yes gene_type:complete